MYRARPKSALVGCLTVLMLASCATSPEPTTHDAWLARQMEIWNSIRECNPELAMCHRRRERLNLSAGCFPPEYPFEARRRGEEGRTQVRIDVQASGQVSSVTLVRGSGHRSIDEAATKGYSACKFPKNLKAQTESGSRFFIEYVWQLENAQGGAYIHRVPG